MEAERRRRRAAEEAESLQRKTREQEEMEVKTTSNTEKGRKRGEAKDGRKPKKKKKLKVKEELGGSPEWRQAIEEEAMEAIEKIRRKEGEKIRHKLTIRGKEICKMVGWVCEEAKTARVEIRYGGRTIEKEVRKHDRKALERLIEEEMGLRDFWIRREKGRTMEEGVWKGKQMLFVSPKVRVGMLREDERKDPTIHKTKVKWGGITHEVRHESDAQFWEIVQREIVDLWGRKKLQEQGKRPIVLMNARGRISPPDEDQRRGNIRDGKVG
jgi:hypothetical protein